jgi:HPt (histidine-containing phosphotransfer) domain-containing protein
MKDGLSSRKAKHSGSQGGAGRLAILRLDEALERCDGDRDFLRSIVRVFRQNLPRGIAILRSAVEVGDAPRIEIQAHALAGIAATLAAQDLHQAARHLERLGASRKLNGAAEALEHVLEAAARLEATLEQEGLIE